MQRTRWGMQNAGMTVVKYTLRESHTQSSADCNKMTHEHGTCGCKKNPLTNTFICKLHMQGGRDMVKMHINSGEMSSSCCVFNCTELTGNLWHFLLWLLNADHTHQEGDGGAECTVHRISRRESESWGIQCAGSLLLCCPLIHIQTVIETVHIHTDLNTL